jgi:hypothetical protein
VGNAVVPQCAEVILKGIREMSNTIHGADCKRPEQLDSDRREP